MKIFTLLQNLLKMITGQTGRNLTFNAGDRESAGLNAQRVTPNVILHSGESVPQVNMTSPINDASVSFEYKILPVQKKITSVPNIKPVFMQNFFAIVKKIFSLSDHPETLIENLNDGYHPGCHYGTAGNENISGNNLHHDVANEAASFALIPIALTPTAMNQLEKKSVKTITGRSGLVGILMLMSSMFFVSTAMAQTTTLFLQSTTTQTGASTGGFVRDLSLTQGTGGTVQSNSTTSGTSVQVLAFTIDNNTLVNAISGNSFNVNVNVNAVSSTNLSSRFRLQHLNSAGTVLASTGFSGTFNSTGTKNATLSFGSAQTFVSGDRLLLSIELLSTNGNSRNITISTGNANSFVQYCTTPNIFNVTGGGSLCSGGPGAPIGLDGSQSGVSYQLLNGATPVGAAVAGTGAAINFPAQTTAGTYTVTANTSIGGCTSNMTGSASVVVTPSPTITLGGNPAICSGATSANLNYSATTNSPDQYSITWGATATTAGFSPVVSQPLAASPGTIIITVPAAVAAGTYTGTLTVTNSGTTCSSTGTSFSVIVSSGSGSGWLGTTSSDWFDASNWCGGVPTSTSNVTIPGGTPNQPLIGASGAVCNDINIAGTATLTITGTNILTVSGNWTKLGTLVPNNSTVVFNSATSQTVSNGGTGNFYNVTIGGAGTLQVVAPPFTATNSFNISGGGTLDLNGVTTTLGDLLGNGSITNTNAAAITLTVGGDNANTTYSGIIQAGTGAISLTKTGTGSLTLSGANAYTGATTLTSGTLNINSSSAIGTGAFNINGGTIDNTSGSALTLSTNNIVTIGANFAFGGTNNLNFGTGAVSIGASRTITLNGTGSILTFGALTNTGASNTATVNGAGNTLVFGGYALSNSGTSRNNVFNGNANVIISGVVSNGGTATASSLAYSGTGALTLSGANTHAGGTSVSSGTLNINNASALGSGAFTISGGTIDNTSGADLTLTTNNPITFGGNFTFGATSNLTFGTGAITNNNNRTITLNGAGTILSFGGTMTNSSGATQTTTINGVGNNFILGGIALSSNNTGRNSTITGSANVTISGPITNGGTGAGSLTFSGTGMLTLNGNNTYTGATTLNSGTLNINTATAIGTGAFTITGGVIDNTSGSAVTLSTNNAQNWNGDFTFNGSNALNLGTGNVTIATQRQVTISANTLTDGGNFSGAGGFTKLGTGLLILTGNTNNTGATTIAAGELRLNPTANSTSATPVILNGGVLGTTGITATRTITGSGTLALLANSTIKLDPVNAHSISFGPSNSVTWTPGAVLTVNGWQGVAGSPGTVGKIFFGNSLGTLTNAQLAQITFTGFEGIPIILAGTGEIVPQGAAPTLTVSGNLNNGSACVNSSANFVLYTITNIGSTQADGISVSSDNTQFVVSELSGTTAQANSQNPLTFKVTFTPTSAGAQSANITITSTTSGSNSPVAVVTGTGLANPVATFGYDNAFYCQALATNPNTVSNPSPTFTGGGVAGTFSAVPAGLVFVSTTTGQVDIKQSAPGTYTVTNLVTGANGCSTSATNTIIINALPAVDITYGAPAYCKTDLNVEHVIGVPGSGVSGSFSVFPSGLTLNTANGDITPSSSAIGDYKVVFTFTDGVCSNTDTAFVSIAQTASGTIAYTGTPYCTNSGIANVTNSLTGTTTGGTYSSTAGLTINAATGAVTTSTSTAGTYTVTFAVPAIGACDPFSTTTSITITDTPVATISYGGTNLCSNGGVIAPIISGPSGGTFTSSPAGLSINASGNINTALSTVGTYTVTYHTPAINGCVGSPNTTVIIQTATNTPVLNTSTICTGTSPISITLSNEANTTPIQVRANGVTVVTLARTGTTANYTIPAGTFHTGDVITITAQATGKCLSTASNAVTVGAPVTPSAITGNSTVCPGTTGNSYSVTAVTGVTYAWSYNGSGATIVNGGTASPTINFTPAATSGTLTVTTSNTCGSGASQTLAITVNSGPPGATGAITGPAAVCTGLSQTYSIDPVANATNYTWTVPTGWNITSGQGTPSINVTAGAPGQNGNITVFTSNVCGNGTNPASNAVTTAPLNAGTGTNNNATGNQAWTNPGNITAAGTPFATAAFIGLLSPTNYLIGTNYGFNIPANASITGITVSINRNANNNTGMVDNVVSLVKSNTVLVGSNLASASNWPTGMTPANYGGANILWGTNWSPADINSAGFGVALSVANNAGAITSRTATVDYMQISVTYATPQSLPVTVTSGPTITLNGNPVVTCNGGTSANLLYSATTGSPDQYSITYDAAALGAGFSNVGITSLPASPISLTIPGSLPGGVYNGTITVSSSAGCIGTPTAFTVTVPNAITTTSSETDALCFGGSTGTATVTPAGGNGVYTVNWTGPNSFTGTGTTITGLVAGTYNYAISDGNLCGPLNGSVVVGEATQVTATASHSDASCFGESDGSASVTPGGGTSPYTITWTGPGTFTATGPSTGPVPAGTYTYLIVDANGCGNLTADVIVGQPASLAVTPMITPACADGSNGSVTIVVSDLVSIVALSGGPDIIPNTATPIAPGDYQYFLVNGGCSQLLEFTVGQNTPVVVANDGSKTDATCNGGANGSITLGTVSGGTGTYTYSWTTSDGSIPAGQAIVANPTGLTAGTYTYVVTDNNGCTAASATGSFTINQPTAVVVANNGSKTDVTCNGGTNGSITLGTVSGGSGTYTYSWTTSDGTIPAGQAIVANPTGLTAGTYTYVVTDDLGCTGALATGSFTINQPAAVVVANDGSKTDVTCNGGTNGSITLGTVTGGSGTYTYAWTTGDGTIPAGQAIVANPTGLTAGTYTYVVTDNLGCTGAAATGSFTIAEPTAVAVANNGSQTNISCNGGTTGSITLGTVTGGSGTYTYAWTTSDGTIPAGQAIVANPTGLTAGTYTYVVTDDQGCTSAAATGSFTITQSTAVVVANNGSKTDVTCNGGSNGSITLGTVSGGSGSYTYSWTTLDGTISAGQAIVANPTGLTAGTYTYIVTDNNGCTGASATGNFTIAEPTAVVVANNGSKTDVTCNGGTNGSITLGTVTGGSGTYTYAWTTSDGTIPAGQAIVANPTGLTAGTYTYVVTDNLGCTGAAATGSFTIAEPTAVVVANNGSKTDVTCNGDATGSITLGTVTGGSGTYTYAWTTSDGTIPAGQAIVANPTGLTAGTYTFIVTDNNGCTGASATGSFTIAQPAAIAVAGNGSKTDIACNGGSNGSITLGTVSGGTAPYTYTWTTSNGSIPAGQEIVANPTGLTAGTYNYSVTDINHCTAAIGSVVINQSAAIVVSSVTQGTIACNGGTTTVTIHASGGTGALSYTFDGVTNSTGIFTHAAGNNLAYSVTDANSCTPASSTVNIIQPDVLAATFTSTNITCFGANNGTVTINVTGGTPAYLYSIDGNTAVGGTTNSSRTFTGLAPGGHTVVITDNNGVNGCTTSVTFTLTQPTQLTAIASAGTVSCNSSTTSLFVIASGGTAPYTYSLNGGAPQSGFVFTVGAGNYIVTVTDASSCTVNTASVSVANPTQMTIDITGVTASGCSGATGSFNISASGGAGSYTYSLNGGAFQPSGSFTGLAANTYLATAKDANGCTVSGSVTINGGTPPTVFNVTGGGSSCSGSGFPVGLSNAQAGVTYFLLLNNTIIGSMPPANILPGFAFSFGNQTAPGVYTVIASNPATGCIANMSGSATITGGTPPTAFTVTGGGNYCNGAGLPIGLSNSQGGVSYQLVLDGTNTGASINGNGSAISFGNQTAIGTYTVVATNATNCTNNMSNSVSITGGSLPTPFTVSADPDNCTGLGVHIRLAASQLNVNYQLYLNGSIDGAVAPVAGGNGSPIDFGPQPSGTYTVVATTSAGCTASMTGSVTVVSSSLPIAYGVTGGGSYCSGGLGLHVGLQNSESGVTYQLFNGAIAVSGFFPGSTGSQIDFGLFQAGTYTVVAKNATGCTNNMTGSATIALTPTPAAVTLIAPNGVNDCTGTGADIQLSSSESGVSYQLYVNGIAMGSLIPGTGNPIDLGKKPSGTYTIVGISNTGGCIGNTSNSITINSGTAPTAYTVTGGGSYCSGPGVAIGLSNSQTGVTYVLMLNGTTNVGFATGTNGNSLSFGNYTANGTYSVVATNTITNCTATMLNSVSINAGSSPAVFNVTGGGNYCSGGTGVKVGLSGSDNGINYQLMLNGSPTGAALVGNGSALDFGFQTAGTYTVVATNTQAGCTSNMNGSALITINGASVIINTQPLSQEVCITSSVTLSVSATNATGYQWFIGSSPIVGATGPTYSTGTSGSYTVVVSGICGAPVTSAAAILSPAPVVAINTQPAGGAFCGSIQLSVGASNATGYQWFNGAASIAGATNPTYTATAAGSYTVVVSGNCGAPVTSSAAVLTAIPVVSINTQPTGGAFCGSTQLSVGASNATGYQWFNGASSIAGATNPTYTATAAGSYTVVVSGNCGAPVTSSAAVLTTSPAATINTQPQGGSFCGSIQLSVGASNATGYQWFNGANSIAGATNPTYTATAGGSYTVVVSGACGAPVTSSAAVLTTPAPVSINTQPQGGVFTGSNLLSVGASNATGYQWYNGTTLIPGATGTTYTATAAGTYHVVVSGMCGSSATSADAILSACPAVTINTQPVGGSFCGSKLLSVGASNATTYQWKKGGSTIIGATSATYTATSAGSYTVDVSGNCGSPVTSTPAVLTAASAVTINTQPVGGSFCGSIQLSVGASNANGYQWQKGGINIGGATNSTYTATTAGTYRVIVSGSCGSPVTSNQAVLTAGGSVTINTQPTNKSICSGGSATFSVSASNASGYQWFKNNNSIPGATNPTYTTGSAGNYKVVVSGGCGSPVTSNTVTLSVSAGVTIITQPVSTQICAGGTESFSVVANNATGYQWYRNSNLIIGATNSQYFTSTTGRYDCRVFDACGGSVMSDFAFLTINGPVAITSQPQSQTICTGGAATFAVSANNANAFQWYRNNNPIPGAVNTSYTTSTAGNYKVVVRGGCGGPITSNTATLSFLPAPPVAGINGTGSICTGTTVRFTDATSGGTWSSSDNSIATVSATGFVRGVSAGNATIRYTISNGCSSNTATRNITVNGVPNVQDITGSSSVCPGSTIQLSDGTPNGDWSSSNTSIATVSNNGRVRGIRNGNVTISYTVQNSCGMKTVSTPIAVNCSFQKNSLGAATNSDEQLTLNVTVGPNPSQNFFTLIAQSSVLDAPINISIFDMQNRMVDRHTAGVGEAVRFGDRLAAGMYIIQVTQGGLQKTVKVVKN